MIHVFNVIYKKIKPFRLHRIILSRTSCGENKEKRWGKKVEMPGIEPGASRMRSERSTTELHPQSCQLPVKFHYFQTDLLHFDRS